MPNKKAHFKRYRKVIDFTSDTAFGMAFYWPIVAT
jgi:hypothetical protein